jgi:RNA-directed DNA polymerase
MKESYGEDLASHTDPQSCTVACKDGRKALTGACAGGLWSREILIVRGADAVPVSGRQHLRPCHGKRFGDLARSKNPGMHRNTSRENREIPCLPVRDGAAGRGGKSKDISQRCTNTGSLTGG